MKKSLIALAAFAVLGTSTSFAQSGGDAPDKGNAYVFGKFSDNWFISVGAGVRSNRTIFNGPDGSMGDNSTMVYDFAVGKWISPLIGARIQYNGFESATKEQNLVDKNWDSNLVHVDLMANLSSILYTYNPERFYELIAFAGSGIYFAGEKNKELYLNAGLINKFRICDKFDANLELRLATVSSRVITGNEGGSVFVPYSASVGVTYYLGKNTKFKTVQQVYGEMSEVELAPLRREVSSLRSENADLKSKNNRLSSDLNSSNNKLQAANERAAKSKAQVEMFNKSVVYSILFRINHSTLSNLEIGRLSFVAKEIKNSNANYVIEGHADAATGTPEYNAKLSEARAKAIYDVLVNTYGVDANRLTISAKGGIESGDKLMLDRNAIVRVVIE